MNAFDLWEKSRHMLRSFQEDTEERINYQDIARTLKEELLADVYVINREGKIEGCAVTDDLKCQILERQILQNKCLPAECSELLLRNNSPGVNLQQKPFRCLFFEGLPCSFEDLLVAHIPIIGGDSRLGTLLQVRCKKVFEPEDLVLAEIGAALLGRKILNKRAREKKEKERLKNTFELAVHSLSHSEGEALKSIIQELGRLEETLVCSKTARRHGASYSAVRSTLRKLESAGIIRSYNMGHKGIHVSVLNPYFYEYSKVTEETGALAD